MRNEACFWMGRKADCGTEAVAFCEYPSEQRPPLFGEVFIVSHHEDDLFAFPRSFLGFKNHLSGGCCKRNKSDGAQKRPSLETGECHGE
jgi:hypothetical protein